jgi:nitrite reductase/ring-hydroxylating ferredoxin subunit
MEALIPDEGRALCRAAEIPDGTARGFPPAPGGFSGLLAWRKGDDVRVYVNACPHIGTPLDWTPDRFMTKDGKYLICATHGAAFAPLNGECLLGPCKGDRLEAVTYEIRDGVIVVASDAGL